MRKILATTALSLALVAPALAGGSSQNHTCQGGHNCNTGGGTTGGTGGAGGAGGAGGNGYGLGIAHSQAAAAAAAQATNNTRVNATGGNAIATGGTATTGAINITNTVSGGSATNASTSSTSPSLSAASTSAGGSSSSAAPAAGALAPSSAGNAASASDPSSGSYTYTVHNTPDVTPPSVVGGNACAVGASGGIGLAGFGIAAGATWADRQCERRQQAALLFNMGEEPVSRELLCQDSDIRSAMKAAGKPCAEDAVIVRPASAVIAAPVVPTSRPVRPEWCYTASAAERARHPECGR